MGQKTAIVTGAGSGIGRAVAIALLNEGYAVALCGRRAGLLEETAKRVNTGAAKALVIPTDVTAPESVTRAFDAVKKDFGRLDVLFNNTDINVPGATIDELTVEQWRSVVDVNLTGAFLCAREAFRLMKMQTPRGGRIINNGSISAYVPRPYSAPYTATKHGITGLTKSISLDGRKFDIVCSQIDIGNAATELAAKMAQGVPQADGEIRSEPLMDLDHVARGVVYMAGLPLEANVQFMTLMATKMPFIGRG
jgi:NAD(P)-dependent dehydrogenase (short-subunit alcohol dehydrogenase family)